MSQGVAVIAQAYVLFFRQPSAQSVSPRPRARDAAESMPGLLIPAACCKLVRQVPMDQRPPVDPASGGRETHGASRGLVKTFEGFFSRLEIRLLVEPTSPRVFPNVIADIGRLQQKMLTDRRLINFGEIRRYRREQGGA